MHHEQLQHMIAFIEEEARSAGFEYSADFLKLAARAMHTEATLTEECPIVGKTPLENFVGVQ